MWPGYETATSWFNDGIFLNVDTATKFITRSTILEDIDYYMKEEGYSKSDVRALYKPENEEAMRKLIITEHNTKSYQIDDITFDKTPKTHIFGWKDKFGN